MKRVISEIYNCPEADLKKKILDIDADDIKEAATFLGITHAVNGKTVARASRVDNAMAIKALEKSVIDAALAGEKPTTVPTTETGNQTETPSTETVNASGGDQVVQEAPSVAQATETVVEEDPEDEEDEPVDELDAQRKLIADLKKQLEEETEVLRQMINERAEKVPTLHELRMMVKAKREAEAEDEIEADD